MTARLTVKQAAVRLAVGEHTVRRLINRGLLGAVNVCATDSGRVWRIPEAALVRFEKERSE